MSKKKYMRRGHVTLKSPTGMWIAVQFEEGSGPQSKVHDIQELRVQ